MYKITNGNSMIFGYSFNESLNNITIPPSVYKIQFGFHFNQYLYNNKTNTSKLPNHITHLIFGNRFNHHVNNLLNSLPNLIHLHFGASFNRPISNISNLHKLTHLSFSYAFNQSITNLPPNLEYLEVGHSFRQPLVLPQSLTHMIFGYRTTHAGNLNAYYLLKYVIHSCNNQNRAIYDRCDINRHNLLIKQTAFYDLL